MKRKIAIVLICCLFFMMVPLTSMASSTVEIEDFNTEPEIAPRWTCIVDTFTNLNISGNTALADCWVKGDVSTATKAKVIVELQVKNSATNWIPVAIWTDTQNDFMAYVYETKEINPNNTYRIKATYTVWEGSQSETTTVFTD